MIRLLSLLIFSSTRRQGMWLRSANWEWCTFLHLSHHRQFQKVLRKDHHLEALFQKMEMSVALSLHRWLLNLYIVEINCFLLPCIKLKYINCDPFIAGNKSMYWTTWGSREICRGEMIIYLFFTMHIDLVLADLLLEYYFSKKTKE